MTFRSASPPSASSWTGAVVTVLLIWLAYGMPWISGTVTVPWDAKAHFQPQLQFLAQSLHSGQPPFWTPNVFSGWPQIADPQSLLFSPFHLLLAAFDGNPSLAAADTVALGALLWGAIGLMAHGRDRGWHPAGLVVAALVFMMGGSASARLQHTGQILSLSVWPWALWALARVLQAPTWKRGLWAGVFVAWLAIGRDQVAFLALVHLSAFTLWRLVSDRDAISAPLSRRLRALAISVVVTLALAAVPVLLTLPLLAASNRPAIDFVMSARSSLPPAFGFVALIPDLYGSLGPAAGYWGPASEVWGDPMLWTDRASGHVYFGALTALLILGHGLLGQRLLERRIRFDALAALAFGIYAVGWYTPVYRLLFDHVPGIDLFRRPADATFHLGFTVALLAGHLAHRAATEGPPRLNRLARLGALLMVTAVIGGALLVAHTHHQLDAAASPLLHALAWMGLAAAALGWVGRRSRSRPLLATLALALPLAADLIVHHGPNEMNALPPSTYDALRPDTSNRLIQALKTQVQAHRTDTRRDRVEMVGLGFDVPNAGLVHGLEHILGYNPLRLRDYQAAVGAEDDVAVWQMRHFTKAMPGYQSPMSDLLGLRWIASSVPLQTIDPRFDPQRWPAPQRLAEGWLYENPNALPRVLRTDRVRVMDPARLIVGGDWPADWDPTRTVLLPALPPGLRETGAEAAPAASTVPAAPSGHARLARYDHTRIDIDTEAPTAGVVLLNEIWHPWWRAEVNGQATPILRANGLMRAVQVPAGASRIVFRFHPFAGAWRELTHRLPAPVWVSPH